MNSIEPYWILIQHLSAAQSLLPAGATSALPAILLDAKTLLTETITKAAIAANINFFIILSF